VGLVIRPMHHSDVGAGLRLCRLAGWDQVARDWSRFVEGPDSSGYAAVQGSDLVATIATVRYGHQFGWIGMVLVDPDAQGRGIGSVMVAHAVEALSDMPAVRLDATPAGRLLYQKHGFVDQYPLTRMEAMAVHVNHGPRSSVRPMTRGELPAVIAMDHDIFGAQRTDLLEWMYDGAPEFAFVAERHANLSGYVFGRHGHQFEHLGPLVADDDSVAVNMTKACLAQHRGRAFVIDTPQHDDRWIRILEQIGFRPQRGFVRMSRGRPGPFGSPRQQFAVLGPEFG
jgi:GNAT superfamily N-acetyltransferase